MQSLDRILNGPEDSCGTHVDVSKHFRAPEADESHRASHSCEWVTEIVRNRAALQITDIDQS